MSFLGGFAKSLSNTIREGEAQKRESEEWEYRNKKLMELEEISAKRRVVGKQPEMINGKLMMQPVNAAGEPVGNLRPATQFEQQQYAEDETKKSRETKSFELGEREASARATKAEKEAAGYDAATKLAEREAESGIAARLAQADQARAVAERTRIENGIPQRGGGRTIELSVAEMEDLTETAEALGYDPELLDQLILKGMNYSQIKAMMNSAARRALGVKGDTGSFTNEDSMNVWSRLQPPGK